MAHLERLTYYLISISPIFFNVVFTTYVHNHDDTGHHQITLLDMAGVSGDNPDADPESCVCLKLFASVFSLKRHCIRDNMFRFDQFHFQDAHQLRQDLGCFRKIKISSAHLKIPISSVSDF